MSRIIEYQVRIGFGEVSYLLEGVLMNIIPMCHHVHSNRAFLPTSWAPCYFTVIVGNPKLFGCYVIVAAEEANCTPSTTTLVIETTESLLSRCLSPNPDSVILLDRPRLDPSLYF